MQTKAIFWDNDGVLVDTERLYYQANAEALAAAGIELDHGTFTRISLKEGKSVLSLAQDLPSGTIEKMRHARDARYAELLQQGVRALDGVAETLKALHGTVQMAIVTSSRRQHFDLIHRTTGLLPFFDFVLVREDYVHSKPHPEPYLTALQRSGLHPGECLVVEDSERGLAAAVAAGLRCVVIPHALTGSGDFSEAHHLLDSVRALPAVIA